MQITFIDTNESWKRMLPLTYTRPVADIRVGILKVHEKWEKHLNSSSFTFRTENYLSTLFQNPTSKTLTILGTTLPNPTLVGVISILKENQALVFNNELIAGFYETEEIFEIGNREAITIEGVDQIQYPWDIFRLNRSEIKHDFELLTKGKKSSNIDDPHTCLLYTSPSPRD